MTRNATSASCQFIASMTPMMNIRVKTSPKIATTPEVNISFRTSTSLVSRVISRPTGLRSKKRTDRRCSWAKISVRRSYMTRWPIQVVSSVWA